MGEDDRIVCPGMKEEDVEEYDTTQPVDSVITITPDILE